MNFRVSLIFIGISLFYVALISNLYNLQIKKGDYYTAKAESQYRLAGFLEAKRGTIHFIDKNHNRIPAAINKLYPVIFAVPKEVTNIDSVVQKLSELLKLDGTVVKEKLSKPGDLYELLVLKASADQVAAVRQASLPGIHIDDQEARFYPFQSLAAQVLGFVGSSHKDDTLKGRYGIEAYFNEPLSGKNGRIKDDKMTEPVVGEDVVLTIDRNIQSRAEEILKAVIEKHGAVSGTVIVQEPSTGRILALGNYPNFDPNNYSISPIGQYLNPAVQSLYEPGSVFKVITMAIGLDLGVIRPDTEYYDSGSVTFDSRTIKNWDLEKNGPYGKISMTKVIERSVNTGAVFAQRKIGQDHFYNYLLKFGLHQSTGVSLPGEVAGNVKNLKTSFRDINFATASFGQGISVTPLSLINAVSAIANKGLLMRPLVLLNEEPSVIRRVISEKAAAETAQMMTSAVQKAEVAQVPNYKIAGKTGTAQIPNLKHGGYTEEFIHTFVGFAPVSDPRFTILFKVDKPRAPLAGATVVPAFRELAEFVLKYYNTLPDDLYEKIENRK